VIDKEVSDVRLPIWAGSEPRPGDVFEIASLVRAFKEPISGGMGPTNNVLPMFNSLSWVRLPIEGGIVPWRGRKRSSTSSLLKDSKFGGRVSLLLGRCRLNCVKYLS
jgi:hypothetical protein